MMIVHNDYVGPWQWWDSSERCRFITFASTTPVKESEGVVLQPLPKPYPNHTQTITKP